MVAFLSADCIPIVSRPFERVPFSLLAEAFYAVAFLNLHSFIERTSVLTWRNTKTCVH